MKIQFNTDNNIEGSERLSDYFSTLIEKELKRFDDQITRVEVYLSDQDGSKNGPGDKKCTLEARPRNLNPIAVTNHGNSHEEAIKGAVEKLKTSLTTVTGCLNKF